MTTQDKKLKEVAVSHYFHELYEGATAETIIGEAYEILANAKKDWNKLTPTAKRLSGELCEAYENSPDDWIASELTSLYENLSMSLGTISHEDYLKLVTEGNVRPDPNAGAVDEQHP